MRMTAFGRSSLAAVSVVCLAVPVVTPAATAGARQPVTISYGPALAALALPGDHLAAAQYTPLVVAPDPATGPDASVAPALAAPVEIVPAVTEPVLVVRESGFEIVESGGGVTAAAAVQPVDVANAISAFGYLVVAMPSLLFTIPIQILTNQRAAIVTSLNNIITAVNTILKLFGRSIPPIPTEEAAKPAELRSAAEPIEDSVDIEEEAPPATEELDAKESGSRDANSDSGNDAEHTAPDNAAPDSTDADPVSEEPTDPPGEDAETGETTDVTVEDADDSAPAESETAADESKPGTRTDGNDPGDGDDQKGGPSQPAG